MRIPVRCLWLCVLSGLSVFAATAQSNDHSRLMAQAASGQVIACAWSAGGHTVLTGGWEGRARLWDAASGEELQSYQGEAWITHVAFSTDHRNVLTVSSIDEKTTVQLWDAARGKELGRMTPAGELIYGIDSADGSTIATANRVESEGQGNKLPTGAAKIQLWNVVTGKELSHFMLPGVGATSAHSVLSPDGKRLFSGNAYGPGVWDVETGKLLRGLGTNDGVVSAAAFSADGRRVAWGTYNGVVRLWDLDAGKEIQHFASTGVMDSIGMAKSIVISPDGRSVLVASDDRKARVWDVETGKVRMLIHAADVDAINMAVNCATPSPDGRQALTVADDHTARLWDLESGKELRRLIGRADEVAALAFVADGHGIVYASRTGMVWQWNAESGKALLRSMESSQGNAPLAAVSADGRTTDMRPATIGDGRYVYPLVLSPDGRRMLMAPFHGEQGVWDVETGKQIQKFDEKSAGSISTADFSPDGSKVLTASRGPDFSLWDVQTGKEVQHFKVNPGFRPRLLYPEGDYRDGVKHLALSPDGHRAVTSDSEGSTRLWNVDTGEQVRVIKVKTMENLSVGFSPDSRKMITENVDGSATLRDVKWGRELQHFGKASQPSFSADGRRALMGGSVWDVETGKELRHFEQASGTQSFGTLSPDGRRVLIGGQDGATMLWDVNSGKELARLYGFMDGSWAVIDPEGRFDTDKLEGNTALHWVVDGDPMRVLPLADFKDGHYTPGLLKCILNGEKLNPVQ